MDVFETLTKTIAETSQAVAEKAKLVADIIKVRDQIRAHKKQIRILTYKIGQSYLEMHENDPDAEFSDFIRGIQEARTSLDEKKQSLSELRAQMKFGDFEDLEKEFDDIFAEEEVSEETAEEAKEETAVAIKCTCEESCECAEETTEEGTCEESCE